MLLGIAMIASVVSLAAVGRIPISRATGAPAAQVLRVHLQHRVVEYGSTRVSVSGVAATGVDVRLAGADDPRGRAYHWASYRWRRLASVRGKWRGTLVAPPLRGIYRLQFRIDHSKPLLQSPLWLLRVLPPGTLKRPAFPTGKAVVRDYVRDLSGNQVLVAAHRYAQPAYDHRDPRLIRLFVIAYGPQSNKQPGSELGLFITTVRNGYHGRWRLLEATINPPD